MDNCSLVMEVLEKKCRKHFQMLPVVKFAKVFFHTNM